MVAMAGYHAHWRDLISSSLGGMAERTNALVLKTSVAKATEGSNPSPSAMGSSQNRALPMSKIQGLGRRASLCAS